MTRRKVEDLNLCARPGCGHSADIHAPGGACTNQPTLEDPPCYCEAFQPQHRITTRVLMDAQYRTWEQWLGHQDPPVGENGRAYWRPSIIGYCARKNVMWRRGVPATRVEDPEDEKDKLRRFAWGNMLEKKIVETYELAGVLIARQTTLEDIDLQVEGKSDALWGGLVRQELPERARFWEADYAYAVRAFRTLVDELAEGNIVPVTMTEIKTTHSHAVRKTYKEGPRIDHRIQSGCYLLISRRHPEQLPTNGFDRYELTIVGRDAVRPICFSVSERDAQLAGERLTFLNDHWRAGTLPPCTCGTTKGLEWETKYCDYLDPDDPSSCCGSSLLDKLEASVQLVNGGVG